MLQPHSYTPPEDGLPPKEVRILDLRAEPWPDETRRVRIHLETTPFLERPYMEINITDARDEVVSNIHIIESIDDKMTFTMHIRGTDLGGTFTLTAAISYPEIGAVDQKSITFETQERTE
jgi:hypothetical protein